MSGQGQGGETGTGIDPQRLEMRRREAFRIVFGAGAGLLALEREAAAAAPAAPQFLHGVASGDPKRERVIIWTRVTPPTIRRLPVAWRISTTPDMANVVASGDANASPTRDFTVKVDVQDLLPGTLYWYQFEAGGVLSPIGRTRTLPDRNSTAPFAVAFFSCSNFEKGFFNAYREAAKDDGLSAVLHLGDYTYEYGLNGYVTPAIAAGVVTEPRKALLDPPTETVMLDAYRHRLALYRTDPDLQALHAKQPWIVIYDDHETANDSWTGGAENHNAGEGDWKAREAAGLQAWYEWMPIREPKGGTLLDAATQNPTRLYRSFVFGKLARVICLDTRLAGRNEQLTSAQMLGVYGGATAAGFPLDVGAGGAPRSLLGSAQEAWLDTQLAGSRSTWQILANQVLLHFQIAPDFANSLLLTQAQKDAVSAGIDAIFGPGSGAQFADLGSIGAPNPATYDSWNGYPSARQRLYASLARAANPIVVSGDSHNAWVANLAAPTAGGPLPIGVEFGGTSVTSPGYEETFVGFPPAAIAALIQQSSQAKSPGDKLAYADTSRRGYVRLDIAASQVVATYVFLNTVFSQTYTTSTQQFTVPAGARRLAPSV